MFLKLLEVAILTGAYGLSSSVEPVDGYVTINLTYQCAIENSFSSAYYNNVTAYLSIRDDYRLTFDMVFEHNDTLGFTLDSDWLGGRSFDIVNWQNNNASTYKIEFHCYPYDGDGDDIIDVYYSNLLSDGTYDSRTLAFTTKNLGGDSFFEASSVDTWYYIYLPMDLVNYYFTQQGALTYQDGFDDGYAEGYPQGYSEGYIDGYNQADNQDAVATSIFVGIIDVALLPINFFLACLNFEVFGINIGSMVTALLTVVIVIIIVRVFVGNGGGGSKDA